MISKVFSISYSDSVLSFNISAASDGEVGHPTARVPPPGRDPQSCCLMQGGHGSGPGTGTLSAEGHRPSLLHLPTPVAFSARRENYFGLGWGGASLPEAQGSRPQRSAVCGPGTQPHASHLLSPAQSLGPRPVISTSAYWVNGSGTKTQHAKEYASCTCILNDLKFKIQSAPAPCTSPLCATDRESPA